jgi:hypothetical protein
MRLQTLIIILVLIFNSCHRKEKEILVVPGIGIVFGNDTISVGKSTEEDICRVFNIQVTKMRIDTGMACGFTADGEPASWDVYGGEISHDALSFHFRSSQANTLILGTFSLESIEIEGPSKYIIKINDSLVYRAPVRHIENYFTFCSNDTSYYRYELDDYGLLLGLSDTLSDRILDYVKIESVYQYTGNYIVTLDSISLNKRKNSLNKTDHNVSDSLPNRRFGKSEIINSMFPIKALLDVWTSSNTSTEIFLTEEYFVIREDSPDKSESLDHKNLYKIIEDSIFIDTPFSIQRGKIIRASCDTLVIHWRQNNKPDTLSSF